MTRTNNRGSYMFHTLTLGKALMPARLVLPLFFRDGQGVNRLRIQLLHAGSGGPRMPYHLFIIHSLTTGYAHPPSSTLSCFTCLRIAFRRVSHCQLRPGVVIIIITPAAVSVDPCHAISQSPHANLTPYEFCTDIHYICTSAGLRMNASIGISVGTHRSRPSRAGRGF